MVIAHQYRRPVAVASMVLLMLGVTRVATAAEGGASSRAIEDDNSYKAAGGGGFGPPVAPVATPLAERRPGQWYGWQILVTDVAGVGCVAATQHGACLALYALGGPSIHVAHGRPGLAGISLAGRFLLPSIGAMIGASTANCPARSPPPPSTQDHGDAFLPPTVPDFFPCGFDRAVIGAVAGMLVAMGVDAGIGFTRPAIPNDSNATGRVSSSTAPRRRLSLLTPQLSIRPGDFSLGLRGAF